MTEVEGNTLADRVAQAARALQDGEDPQATLDTAARLAVANVPGCDAAGISVVHSRSRVDTEAATDPFVNRADQLQYELRQGPCLDAIWEHHTVHSRSLAYDPRWPRWGPKVVEETGLQSVLSVQLFTHRESVGALNMYSRSKDGFDEADLRESTALAALIASAVVAARRVGNLSAALDTRTVIGQATGILMERFELDAARAFQLLSRLSQTEGRKLRDIASEIVETRQLPGG